MIGAMKSFISKIIFILFFTTLSSLGAKSIETTNRILATVGERTITVLDVKREMDRQLFMAHKEVFSNPDAVYGYYSQNWKHILQKMIHDEILTLEAEKSKYQVKSHDVNQKMQELYGANQIEALKFLSLTPEQARKHSEKELISSHLSWYNVWSKAMQQTTPSDVEKAYKAHIQDLPKKDEWTYQALYVKGKDEKKVSEAAENIASLLNTENLPNLNALLENLDLGEEEVRVGVSKDITLRSEQLSPAMLAILETLEAGKMSDLITAQNGDSFTGKVLHLKGFKKAPIPSFKELNVELKNGMVNSRGARLAYDYFDKLYKVYDVHGLYGMTLQSSTLQPFALNDD